MEEEKWSDTSQGNKRIKKKYGKKVEWFGVLGCCFRLDATVRKGLLRVYLSQDQNEMKTMGIWSP